MKSIKLINITFISFLLFPVAFISAQTATPASEMEQLLEIRRESALSGKEDPEVLLAIKALETPRQYLPVSDPLPGKIDSDLPYPQSRTESEAAAWQVAKEEWIDNNPQEYEKLLKLNSIKRIEAADEVRAAEEERLRISGSLTAPAR